MDTDVIMKANRHGVRLILNEAHSFDQILADITEKLQRQTGFLKKGGEIRVSVEGKQLDPQEIDRLLYELNHLPDTCVHFTVEKDAVRSGEQIEIPPHRAKQRNRIPPEQSQKERVSDIETSAFFDSAPTDTPLFFRGDLTNGQTLEVKKSIIVLGDVAKYAKIISNGNIIVIGALNGEAIAGRDMKRHRFVLALTMEPVHIKIGSACFSKDKRNHKKFHTKDAVIAACENGQLVFQTLSQTSR